MGPQDEDVFTSSMCKSGAELNARNWNKIVWFAEYVRNGSGTKNLK